MLPSLCQSGPNQRRGTWNVMRKDAHRISMSHVFTVFSLLLEQPLHKKPSAMILGDHDV